MKPVDQTTFGVPGGNCYSACIASILELPIEEVPYFMDIDEWWVAVNEWLRPRGFYAVFLSIDPSRLFYPAGFHILGGVSPRGGTHAVVAMGDDVVHDPHPSREGIFRHLDTTIIVPFSPIQTTVKTSENTHGGG